jgi:NADH-quinone oxidoreductase subunit J
MTVPVPLVLLAEVNQAAASLGSLWKIGLPVVLGFGAVYLLLPWPRQFLVGSLTGSAALVLGGWFLIQSRVADAETVLFYTFSGIAILAGGLMVTQRNPLRAALSFALVVLSTCGLFLLQAAPFLMAATIIVYAGAIIVTFIFLLMLAQQVGISAADARSREPFLASVAGFILLGAILFVLQAASPPEQPRPPLPADNVASLGRSLFTDYLVAVELGGTLLLVATIGAIAIAGRRAEGLR